MFALLLRSFSFLAGVLLLDFPQSFSFLAEVLQVDFPRRIDEMELGCFVTPAPLEGEPPACILAGPPDRSTDESSL